jgi:dimeric dUTPase (all-alpha-NTP-PPase superfamily)
MMVPMLLLLIKVSKNASTASNFRNASTHAGSPEHMIVDRIVPAVSFLWKLSIESEMLRVERSGDKMLKIQNGFRLFLNCLALTVKCYITSNITSLTSQFLTSHV